MHPRLPWLCCILAVLLATGRADAAVRYVNVGNPTPAPPYTNWASAAAVIQEAVNVADAGDEVLVTNGVYQTGGLAVAGFLTNRVAVTKPLVLRSVNGPEVTIIQGYQIPGVTNGDGAIRCVYLTNRASLVGFKLRGGATRTAGELVREQSGGGLLAESVLAMVTNCQFVGNAATRGGGARSGTFSQCIFTNNLSMTDGGGTYNSVLRSCRLTGNSALTGGGAYGGQLTDCMVSDNAAGDGGGMYGSTVSRSRLVRNTARNSSGGAFAGTIDNSVLLGNSASGVGGGQCFSTMNYCTVAMNSASVGGGTYFGSMNNCIAYFNLASGGGENYSGTAINYSCTTPMPPGEGNFTNAPLFLDVEENPQLQPGSPCINAGKDPPPDVLDLAGLSRVVGGTADVGAYEFQSPATPISYLWLQQNGFMVDGTADQLDPDGDGASNWAEWRAGTLPRDPASVLRLFPITVGAEGASLRWTSLGTRTYFVERGTNGGAFQAWRSNIPGLLGTTSITDGDAHPGDAVLYRVGVQ